jgi:predicted DCC family thiol-disulfide oxidoreductase YuxK
MDSDGKGETAGDIIFFDGVCLFCRRWARFVLRRDRHRRFSYAWLQSAAARQLLDPSVRVELDSVVLLRDRRCYRKTDAVVRIVAGLGGFWRLATVLLIVPAVLRDACYDFAGRRRYRWFGRTTVCEPPPAALEDRFVPGGNRVDEGSQAAPK